MTDGQFLMLCGEVWLAAGFVCKKNARWICTVLGLTHMVAALCV